MKKTILALAVLGAFASAAQAQTNVTIGGVLSVNAKNYSVGNSTRSTSTEFRVDDDFNSRFWLTGTEDLGGGNSAIFYVENRFSTDVNMSQATGSGLANGDTWVGLRGSWGQVTAGKHSWLSVQGLSTELVNPAGGTGLASFSAMPSSMTGTYSILNQFNGTTLDITRRANSVQYVSPNLSGFVVKAGIAASGSNGNEGNLNCTGSGLQAYVTSAAALAAATCPAGGTATTAGASNYGDGRELFLQGNYINGPLSMQLGYRNNTAEGRLASGFDDKQLRFSGYYALPIGLKIGLQVDRATRSTVSGGAFNAFALGSSVSRTAWELPITYTFGQSSIIGSFTKANDAGTSAAGSTGAKLVTLGWDYALSKRTNVGVFYSRLSNDVAGAYQPFLAGTSFTGSSLVAGESASTFAVGVKHVF